MFDRIRRLRGVERGYKVAQVNIRIDDDLKIRADNIFDELGLNMSTAFTMFIRQTIRQGGIPFEVTTRQDPFYSAENMKVLLKSIQEAEEGKLTAHELIEK
jgi:DNA-damage-inducible protein J